LVTSAIECDADASIVDADGLCCQAVSLHWRRSRGEYHGVEVAPGQNDVLILAVTVVLDMMAHSGK